MNHCLKLLAAACFPWLSLAAQDKDTQKPDPRFPSVLTPAEQESLNNKVKAYFDARIDLDRAESGKREALSKKEKAALDALEKEWDAREKAKKVPLLKHLGDLRAIFQNAVPFKSQSGSGELKLMKSKDHDGKDLQFSIMVPKSYRPTTAYRGVCVMPGWDAERKSWVAPKDWFDKTWKGSEVADSTLVFMPSLANDLDFDPTPDLGKDSGLALENQRNAALLRPLGIGVHEDYRLDFNRLILDCGKGSCGFAVRFATYFPSRFAGLILRHPVDPEKSRLDSLTGLPVLLIGSPETKAACDVLSKKLNELQADSCTVIEGKGGYPFADSKPEIAEWIKKVQRDPFRAKVTLVPNSNFFKNGYWVRIGRTEPLESIAEAERPMLSVQAEREENRITVTSKSVYDFSLLLNDALVNLDKDVTIVVNGLATKFTPQRNLKKMIDQMVALRDTTMPFPTTYEHLVKKPVEEKKEPKGEAAK